MVMPIELCRRPKQNGNSYKIEWGWLCSQDWVGDPNRMGIVIKQNGVSYAHRIGLVNQIEWEQ